MKTTSYLVALCLGLGISACQTQHNDGVAAAGQADDGEDDEGEYALAICRAAEHTDDTCEAAFGEDVTECQPFDDIDEACERGEITEADACALAERLDDACEALFGEDVAECAELDAIDEGCEDGTEEDDDGDTPAP